jgi:serine/threonine-protein kinase
VSVQSASGRQAAAPDDSSDTFPGPALEPSTLAGATGASSSQTLVGTQALREEQDARRRAGLRMNVAVTTLGAIALQLAVKKTTVHWITTAVLAATALAAAATLAAARGGRPIPRAAQLVVALLAVVASMCGIAYLGVLSPVPIVLSIAIYYTALGDSAFESWLMYVACAGGFLLLAILCWLGFLPLTGSVLALQKENHRALLGLTVFIELVLAATFRLARASREATLRAMQKLENARRQIHQRQALLDEARADLARVVDAGKMGRFTGRDVGPFVAGEIIGRGTMGEVYGAVHVESGQEAAVKLLHAYMLEDPALVQRFFREAEVSSALSSPHIVKVLGSGHVDDGSPYLAMELLTGRDLALVLREEGRLGTQRTLELVTQVAQALSVAQEAGIVHRDLKPQNLFLCEAPDQGRVWKVLDFGVAAIAADAGSLTQGAAVGTPSYMSPEQARGQSVDHRADVFSLGVIAYRALTGRPAFAAPDSVATMYQVLHVQPARPSDLLRVHEDVDLALALALAKDREKRFRSSTTFASALRDACRGELDEPFRQAARGILGAHPWGTDDGDPIDRQRSLRPRPSGRPSGRPSA